MDPGIMQVIKTEDHTLLYTHIIAQLVSSGQQDITQHNTDWPISMAMDTISTMVHTVTMKIQKTIARIKI